MSKNEYWMIEKSIDGVAHWWVRENNQYGYWNDPDKWTTDSSKARHYETKPEAEYVIGGEMPGCVATGHIDCTGPDLTKPYPI